MEDTLRDDCDEDTRDLDSLNPCFNGRYSQSISKSCNGQKMDVLILVLMEDTLRELHV